MRAFFLGLMAVFLLLQYQLWFGFGGIVDIHNMRKKIALQTENNQALEQHNQKLIADIKDLKQGVAAVEDRARNDLGLVKEGETFYQIVK